VRPGLVQLEQGFAARLGIGRPEQLQPSARRSLGKARCCRTRDKSGDRERIARLIHTVITALGLSKGGLARKAAFPGQMVSPVNPLPAKGLWAFFLNIFKGPVAQ
jgi:hypothetical protein